MICESNKMSILRNNISDDIVSVFIDTENSCINIDIINYNSWLNKTIDIKFLKQSFKKIINSLKF